ncbi:hypothetical protein EUGRSUZ_J02220 [Eucalyptus grandis]|uniref:Uncharacterized protein n=2 Tax=Eucalyptus grandis TaxID=71139 RepID=A0ACC3J8V3_EUCGR|nr:hypothetical protein EUGRSUZ_J02220 [Eucalyptus grandis]
MKSALVHEGGEGTFIASSPVWLDHFDPNGQNYNMASFIPSSSMTAARISCYVELSTVRRSDAQQKL